MLRAQLAEFGIIFPHGVGHATQFAKRLFEGEYPELPATAGIVFAELCEQLLFLHGKIANDTHEMTRVAKREKHVALLQTIPGVGPITASAIVARKTGKVAAVAMANKTKRMVWAVLTRNESYRVKKI